MLYQLLHKNPESRSDIITVTSGLNILVNILIAAVKVIIGTIASSIAIVSEGVNNLTDAVSSILALIGAKLAKKHPDEKHPFGYGRIEYFTGIIVSAMILVTGIELLISSVKQISEPSEMSVSYLSIIIIAASAIIKFFLGTYTVHMGRKAASGSLIGVGKECRSDSFASVITIVATLVYLIFHISIDAYAGILISFLIIKAGAEVLKDTLSDLLGRAGDEELAAELYRKIRQTDGILAAADMMLHNYGPDAWSGSVNVEIDHSKSVGEIYAFLHQLQLNIMHEYHVTMVFGVYAVDNDHAEVKALRSAIGQFVKSHEHVKSFHAVYIEPHSKKIYCDLIVDYRLKDWDALHDEFVSYLNGKYGDSEIELTIETEYV